MGNEHHNSTMSAARRFWRAQGASRIIFAAYVVLSVLFFGLGIMTAFGLIGFFLREGFVLTAGSISTMGYLLLNAFVAYGFFFCRAWLTTVLAANILFTSGIPVVRAAIGQEPVAVSAVGLVGSAVLLVFLVATRRVWSGKTYALPAIVASAILLWLAL